MSVETIKVVCGNCGGLLDRYQPRPGGLLSPAPSQQLGRMARTDNKPNQGYLQFTGQIVGQPDIERKMPMPRRPIRPPTMHAEPTQRETHGRPWTEADGPNYSQEDDPAFNSWRMWCSRCPSKSGQRREYVVRADKLDAVARRALAYGRSSIVVGAGRVADDRGRDL